MDLMAKIASEETIARAYAWLCDRRRDSHPNNEIWHLLRH